MGRGNKDVQDIILFLGEAYGLVRETMIQDTYTYKLGLPELLQLVTVFEVFLLCRAAF